MGCSPEGSVCWWANVLKSTTVSLQDVVDVGEGFACSVDGLPEKDGPCCLVATSLANLWIVNVSPSVDVSMLPWICIIVQYLY